MKTTNNAALEVLATICETDSQTIIQIILDTTIEKFTDKAGNILPEFIEEIQVAMTRDDNAPIDPTSEEYRNSPGAKRAAIQSFTSAMHEHFKSAEEIAEFVDFINALCDRMIPLSATANDSTAGVLYSLSYCKEKAHNHHFTEMEHYIYDQIEMLILAKEYRFTLSSISDLISKFIQGEDGTFEELTTNKD